MGVYVLSKEGKRVLTALENPEYNWRTVEGISIETGLGQAEVVQILSSLSDQIVQSSVPNEKGQALFTTRHHYYHSRSFVERVLSVFSDRIK